MREAHHQQRWLTGLCIASCLNQIALHGARQTLCPSDHTPDPYWRWKGGGSGRHSQLLIDWTCVVNYTMIIITLLQKKNAQFSNRVTDHYSPESTVYAILKQKPYNSATNSLKAYLTTQPSSFRASVISNTNILSQRPCGRQLNTKVCGSKKVRASCRVIFFVPFFFLKWQHLCLARLGLVRYPLILRCQWWQNDVGVT